MLHLYTFLDVLVPTIAPSVNLTLDFCKYISCGRFSLASLARVALCNCSNGEAEMVDPGVGE